jgi:hypothetical protein
MSKLVKYLMGISIVAVITIAIGELTVTPLSYQQLQEEEQQEYLTYKNPAYGFSIQYPVDWKILTSHTEIYDEIEPEATRTIVEFESPEGATFNVYGSLETPDFLDTNTLTVKNRTAYDYVLDRINTANTFADLTGLSFEHIRNYQTTITKDKIPG